jgi:hypothetical protein
MITKNEFEEWLLHPVTQDFKKLLKYKREDIKERWANGNFTAESADGTKQLNAEALGWVWMLEQVLALDYEGLVQELSDAEQ